MHECKCRKPNFGSFATDDNIVCSYCGGEPSYFEEPDDEPSPKQRREIEDREFGGIDIPDSKY